mgnify:CR=1 FL=1
MQLFSASVMARYDKGMRQDWVLRGFRQFDAPVCVIVTYDRVLDGSDDTPFDCGAVATALVNAAWSRGLGAVINSQGIMQSPVVREHAGIADDQVIMKSIALGWPDESFPANAVASERKSVGEATVLRGFDQGARPPHATMDRRPWGQGGGVVHEGKRREQNIKQNAYIQARTETGAKPPHDIKNLLQSLVALTSQSGVRQRSAGPEGERRAPTPDESLTASQPPRLTKRLQHTPDKPTSPCTSGGGISGPTRGGDGRRAAGEPALGTGLPSRRAPRPLRRGWEWT